MCDVWSEHWQADPPPLQPLQKCWQHLLLYIVAKCHFFSGVTWKDILKYLQKWGVYSLLWDIYISESMLKCVPIASLYTLRVCFYFTDLCLQHCFYTAYRMSYFTQVILTLWKKTLSCNIARRRAVPIKYSACIRTLIIRIIPYPVNSEWPVFAGELWLQVVLGICPIQFTGWKVTEA